MKNSFVLFCCAAFLLAGCGEDEPSTPMRERAIWGISYASAFGFAEEEIGPPREDSEFERLVQTLKIATARLTREESKGYLVIYQGDYWNNHSLEEIGLGVVERNARLYGGEVKEKKCAPASVTGNPAVRCSWEIATPQLLVSGESLAFAEAKSKNLLWMDFHIYKKTNNSVENISADRAEAIRILDSVSVFPGASLGEGLSY
ncbi:MAG TPA: hypothetical protein VJM53_07765 [Burkholderiales bacterium]|jgi:hypothetical protein|nr:hypothetical protein [Burkholderiales bacterium]